MGKIVVHPPDSMFQDSVSCGHSATIHHIKEQKKIAGSIEWELPTSVPIGRMADLTIHGKELSTAILKNYKKPLNFKTFVCFHLVPHPRF